MRLYANQSTGIGVNWSSRRTEPLRCTLLEVKFCRNGTLSRDTYNCKCPLKRCGQETDGNRPVLRLRDQPQVRQPQVRRPRDHALCARRQVLFCHIGAYQSGLPCDSVAGTVCFGNNQGYPAELGSCSSGSDQALG